MPVECHFCRDGTHNGDPEPCERLFISPEEALGLLDYSANDVHVFIANGMGMIVGCDWSTENIKELLHNSKHHIEIADPDGMARSMKHGISVDINGNAQDNRFLCTDEDKLKEFEKKWEKYDGLADTAQK